VNPDAIIAQDNQNFYFDDTNNRLEVHSTLSAELLRNPDFTGNATGWTLASGWAYASNAVSHTSNGTGTLSQPLNASSLTYTEIGAEYIFTYTISAIRIITIVWVIINFFIHFTSTTFFHLRVYRAINSLVLCQ
jgi:hypothetical protein